MKEAVNQDLTKIITPMDADKLNDLLIQSKYDKQKRKFLVKGFQEGFSLHYNGPLKGIQRKAPNLKIRVGSKLELWNKV